MQLDDVFNPDFINPLLATVHECMSIAVAQQSRIHDDGFVMRKADHSPVTQTDTEVQRRLEGFLTAAAPEWGFVGEETVGEWAGRGRVPDFFWLVDPIDGTIEYAKGGDQFAINIALVHGTKPVFGLIAGPVTGDVFYTSSLNTISLHKNGYSNQFDPPARTDAMEDRVLVTGKNCPGDIAAYHEVAGTPAARIIECASAIKFHALLRGAADAYTRHRPTSEWDIAAGHALIAAQGGQCQTLEKTPLTFGHVARGFKLDSVYITR